MVFDFLRRADVAPPAGGAVPASGGAVGGGAVAARGVSAKAAAPGRVTAWGAAGMAGGAGRGIGAAREPAALVRAGFSGNPVGFRCVRLLAEAAAALPLMCQDQGARYEAHPLLGLLARPNGGQGQAEFLEALYGQLLLTGNAWVEAVPAVVAGAAGALPAELHVLRSDRMRVVPGPDGWPVAHDYLVGGRTHRFALGSGPAPVCHIRAFHPLDDHYGLSPLQAAAVAVDVHNSASAWSKALLDNAARPSGAIVYAGVDGQGMLSPDQYDRLVQEMELHHQGARNAGRPMLLEGGLDWKPMGFSPADMEFHETKLAAAREIALAFGVPPMLIGIPGDATYANYAEAHRAFYRLTVLPLAARVVAALSHWLGEHARASGAAAHGAACLRPDPDQVPALAQERDMQWRRVAEASFLTQAEKRALLGLPPVLPGGAAGEEVGDAG